MPNRMKVCLNALRSRLSGSRETIRPSASGLSGRLLGVATLAILLGVGSAQAQKFAIIDMQKAVLATTDGKKAAKAIDDKFAPVKAQI